MKVNKTTRAGYQGRDISCPHCQSVNTVYHFSWSAIQCTKCKLMVDKNEWDIVEDLSQIEEHNKEFDNFLDQCEKTHP